MLGSGALMVGLAFCLWITGAISTGKQADDPGTLFLIGVFGVPLGLVMFYMGNALGKP
jgi:hypothetical protein